MQAEVAALFCSRPCTLMYPLPLHPSSAVIQQVLNRFLHVLKKMRGACPCKTYWHNARTRLNNKAGPECKSVSMFFLA